MPRAREKIEPKFLPKAVCEAKHGTWLILPLGSHILKRDIKEISLIVFENQLIKIRIELVDDWSPLFSTPQGLNRVSSEQNVSLLTELRDIFYR